MITTVELYNGSSGLGLLCAIEDEGLKFKIRRVFTISDVPRQAKRGEHAHIACSQLLFCPTGSLMLHSETVDGVKQCQNLYSSRVGVYVPPLHWLVLDRFVKGTVCVVLCSDLFDEADYIRSYERFKSFGQV